MPPRALIPALLPAAFFLAVLCLAPCPGSAGTVRTFGGDHFEGDVRFDNGAVTITVKGQPVQRIDMANVLQADFSNKKAVAGDGAGPGVQLRSGGVIGGKLVSIDAATVHMMVDGHPMDYPLANVARVIFAPLPDSVAAKIPSGFVGAVLPGGDLFEGEYRGMDDKPPQVKVNSPFLGVHHFGLKNNEILAMAFHDVTPAAAPDTYRIYAIDGSAYGVTSFQPTGDVLSLHDPMAGDVKIPSKQLAAIIAGPARVLPMGTLRAQAVVSVNPAKVPAAFTPDALPTGGPIALAGQTYDGGIAQAAGVAETFAVPPGFGIFTAQAGLPAGASPTVSVVFALLVDGRPVWRSPAVAGGAAPLPVRWNLGNARTLTLAVEPLQPGSLGAPAVWADATLLKM